MKAIGFLKGTKLLRKVVVGFRCFYVFGIVLIEGSTGGVEE